MSTLITMKSIGELYNYKFSIPNYQRGYRWTSQQVKELLDDIWEFSQKDSSLIYCIQPLVVCERKKDVDKLVTGIKKIDDWGDICKYVEDNNVETSQTWEIIDGQQRLTTISIIMQMLDNKAPYSVFYDTLPNSEEKINNIKMLEISDAQSDINLHFMYEAKKTVESWKKLKDKDGEDGKQIIETILKHVKVIWYKTDEKNPISVFTRLNVGRISLTSSELIKALFLNRDNFRGNSEEIIRAKQTQIAQEWDKIENQLQDDEFWLFLRNLDNHKDSWNKPTRIDFLLDFLCKEGIINQMNQSNGKLFCLIYEDSVVGKDKYRTFRIYYECYKSKKDEFLELWNFVKEIFDIWYEWYNHSELYHYVGYVLTEKTISLENLVQKWLELTRNNFIAEVKTIIRKHLSKCKNIEKDYFENNKDNKRDCIPLLLLHNVETIVRQNRILTNNKQYQLGVFYKFPFHLYKIEHWDVEHIDSATENELVDDDSQRYWILSAFQCLRKEDRSSEFCEKLKLFFEEDKNSRDNPSISFSEIYKYFADKLSLSSDATNNWKNKVQNFVLLDSSTNRNYKNAIFPDKRSHIVGKEKGEHNIAYWDKEKSEIGTKKEEFKSAFVPISTKNVFQKTYSTMLGNPTVWDKTDSEDYKNELINTLKEFINDEQQ